ncbi:MAG: hypothetical protein KGR98_06485, partial [Verrucomicrobia bacterium]|nr:hypothetical protein [Verrucomicrobiota bacterium]
TAKALFGRSRVVAGDSYELRIVSDRRAIAVAISPPGAVDAAKTSITQDGRLVRARIEPSVSGTIGWAVRFQ